MQINRLSERIELQRVARVKSAISGERSPIVVEAISVWAEMILTTSDEMMTKVGESCLETATFTFRYEPRLEPKNWRIKTISDNKVWDILSSQKKIERGQYGAVSAGWNGREEV